VRPVRALCATTLLGAALLSGCSSSHQSATPSRTTVTVHAANGNVTIPSTPRRIVSLDPTATETLFAIGADRQVAAVDSLSDYPPGAPKTSLSAYKPNAEAVIAYRPDLVVMSNDSNGLLASLQKVRIPVLLQPAATTLADVYQQITDLGTATGHSTQATALVSTMKQKIGATVAAVPKPTRPLSYYYELTNDLFTVTSKTFIGRLYALFGLRNVADPADKQGSGYPQLSRESLLTANPTMIFLADTRCCGQSAQTVGSRPGWSALTAVKSGNVFGLDDDIASRWGPRVVDLVEAIGAAVQKAEREQ
jgi:iron complex transport system substrate-binding protein